MRAVQLSILKIIRRKFEELKISCSIKEHLNIKNTEMSHPEQRDFFVSVKKQYPASFKNVKVIDCGSLDVNGSLKDLFEDSDYTGVDIVQGGRNVDIVSKTHELPFHEEFDTVLSGEMLEHDEYWELSLKKMFDMVKPGGILALSAATDGRPEHGTTRTGAHWGTSHDYYMNINAGHIRSVLKPEWFAHYEISVHKGHSDIFFLGVKK